jgi:hypothetical protein
VDGLRDVAVIKRKPAWLRNTLQEAEKHVAPHGTFRESKKPHIFSSYMVLMSHIIDAEHSSFEKGTDHQV